MSVSTVLHAFRCRGSPLDVLIIAHLVRFVKGFFTFFFEFVLTNYVSRAVRWWFPSPLDIYYYSRFLGKCKW